MYMNYKEIDTFAINTHQCDGLSSEEQQLLRKYINFVQDLNDIINQPRNTPNYCSTFLCFIRKLKFFLKDGKTKLHFPRSQVSDLECRLGNGLLSSLFQMMDYYCQSGGGIVNILKEIIDLINSFVAFLNLERPVLLFVGNGINISIFRYLFDRNITDLSRKILHFIILVYDGTPETSTFVFSIASLDQIYNALLEDRNEVFSKLIQRFSEFSIPRDKVGMIIQMIKILLDKDNPKNLYVPCFHSLSNIVDFYRLYENEEDKRLIQENFENDHDFPLICSYCLSLHFSFSDPTKFFCSILAFVTKMCSYNFNVMEYSPVFDKAFQMLNMYALDEFPDSDELRIHASRLFLALHLFNFDNCKDYLLTNIQEHFNSLAKLVENDVFSSAAAAGEALLSLLPHVAVSDVASCVQSRLFFYVNIIIESSNTSTELLIRALNYIFNTASAQGGLDNCRESFISFDCLVSLEDRMNQVQNDEMQMIQNFVNAYFPPLE